MARPRLPAIAPLLLLLCPTAAAQDLPDRISFNRHVRPILSGSCFQCHGHDAHARKAGRRLDTFAGATAERKGVRAVVPGEPSASDLLRRVRAHGTKRLMPPRKSKKPALTAKQTAVLERWIEQGAEYEKHWAFLPPVSPAVPRIGGGWGHGPIDRFVAARRQSRGISRPSPREEPGRLIRRVSLDLTGLPPEPADVAAFVADPSEANYEKFVDRLLASPQYGERMAVAWLDAARYGDTSAYHADGPRDMWAWRDWVIGSFRDNLPYDDFTVEQIAGDLIPDGTIDQKTASAFNRNNCTSDEGGAFPEELRVSYIVDRVKTTSMVWLGLTMECAQCHSHKYDPISQEEYYSFYAFFNTTADPGMQTRRGNQKPIVGVVDPVKMAAIPSLREKLDELQRELVAREKRALPGFDKWLEALPANASAPPADMAAYFPLDKSFANAVAKRSKRKAAVHGAKRFKKAKLGAGFQCNGKNYVDLGDIGDFEHTEGFSYGAWIYPEARSHGAALARMQDGNGHRGWDLYLGAGREVSMHLIHRWPGNALKVSTKKKLKGRKWQHVFVTYDGSSKAKGVRIYVDGEHWPTEPSHDSLSKTTRNKLPLRVGRRHPGSPFRGVVDDVRVYRRKLSPTEVATLAGNDPIGDLLRTPKAKRTKQRIEPALHEYLGKHDPKWLELSRARDRQQKAVDDAAAPLTTVMVMSEQPKPRKTFLLNRGSYDSPSKIEVQPNVPAFLPPLGKRPRSRLGLARWLVDSRHPLTARVTVNRFWYQVFGRGLVKTVEDFGAQGTFPSHPDLLDWLATDFIANGWDVKRLMKQIVMSATYRQTARVTPELRRLDPENVFLARGPRLRLEAEFVRDFALRVSGLLVDKVGGPGVKPYQPPGLWNEVSLNKGVRFRQDHGEKLYRRSLYTYWKRSAPPPSLRIFDAPTRESCVIRRPRTNTPLQALVTLNDPQFLEAARCLAQRMIREGGDTVKGRIARAYELVLARQPKAAEIAVFRQTLAPVLADYRKNPQKAEQFLAAGEAARDAKIDVAEHAAWTVVASMILNLDESLTK